jgi:putative phosphoesterase
VRVAALYDVHGNLPALEAVLAEVEQEAPDVVLVGGDVSAGPFPAESLELLRGLGEDAVWIRGNADRELADWPAAQLSEEQRAFLAGLPETVVLVIDELGRVLFCHGSPRSDEEIITERSPDERLAAALAGARQQIVVHGHTHVAYDREWGLYRLICPGSVGMPYADLPGAYWGMFGPGFEQRFTAYDLEAAAARIRASAWPQAAQIADDNVLRVPPADDAIDFFERMAAADDARS